MTLVGSGVFILNFKHDWIKNEVFHEEFFQQIRPHPQETADLVTFTEEIFYGKLRAL